jgi:hypothetical protein
MRVNSIAKILVAVLSVLAIGQAKAAADEREVSIGFNDAFIPSGFDSNSDTFVVASGLYPNGCYRWKDAAVNHVSAKLHEIRGSAVVSQGMCIMVLVPFTKEIHLGKLEMGTHAIRLMNGDGTFIEKSLNIEE